MRWIFDVFNFDKRFSLSFFFSLNIVGNLAKCNHLIRIQLGLFMRFFQVFLLQCVGDYCSILNRYRRNNRNKKKQSVNGKLCSLFLKPQCLWEVFVKFYVPFFIFFVLQFFCLMNLNAVNICRCFYFTLLFILSHTIRLASK